MAREIEWHSYHKKPQPNSFVLVNKGVKGLYTDKIGENFDEWGDDVIKWAYLYGNIDEMEGEYKCDDKSKDTLPMWYSFLMLSLCHNICDPMSDNQPTEECCEKNKSESSSNDTIGDFQSAVKEFFELAKSSRIFDLYGWVGTNPQAAASLLISAYFNGSFDEAREYSEWERSNNGCVDTNEKDSSKSESISDGGCEFVRSPEKVVRPGGYIPLNADEQRWLKIKVIKHCRNLLNWLYEGEFDIRIEDIRRIYYILRCARDLRAVNYDILGDESEFKGNLD